MFCTIILNKIIWEHKFKNCSWMTKSSLKQKCCRPNFFLISFPSYNASSPLQWNSFWFTPLCVRKEWTHAFLLKTQYHSEVLFYGAHGKVRVKKKKLKGCNKKKRKKKNNHQVNACNTVTCLINIMGLILPGLSSAYVGERGKAHSRAGAQAGSASREGKIHILHRLHCPH